MLYAGSGSPIPNDNMEQFKASDQDWQVIELQARERFGVAFVGLCDLRDRVAALEAAPVRFIVRNESGVYQKAGTPVYLADPAPEVPTPEPEPSDFQTLHGSALDIVDSLGRSFNLLPEILDTLRRAIREPMAEQQVATEKSSAAQSDPQVLFSATLAGSSAIRWEDVINALTIAEAKLFDLWEYSKGIDPWCLQVADTAYPAYRAVHDLMNECRRTGATGAIGGLASPPSTTPEPEPSPSQSDGWLIAALEGMGLDGKTACFTLLLVARWLSRKNYDDSAAELAREANR